MGELDNAHLQLYLPLPHSQVLIKNNVSLPAKVKISPYYIEKEIETYKQAYRL